MGKALRITLIVIGVLAVAGGLVFTGAWIGRGYFYGLGGSQASYRMMNGGINIDPERMNGFDGRGSGTGQGMMNGRGNGFGSGTGMMGGGFGSGTGMMGNYGSTNTSATPLTADQAYQAATTYLVALNNSDLKIAEVMVFDNNTYVRVVEQSTGISAFELLVNPATLAVTPEPGPNMMWNLKYGGMNHQGMMGGGYGMMGNSISSSTPAASGTMPVSAAQALQAAQQYLNTALPGSQTASDADPFYGYYTIDILRDGNIIGMLSVNGYNSQVFLHTWHGTFIATQDY
jgi:hypothetical protein